MGEKQDEGGQMKRTLKLWRYRLRFAWSALRGDFDGWLPNVEYDMPLDDTWALTEEQNSLLGDLPFVETTETNEFKIRTTLPPQAWRKLIK